MAWLSLKCATAQKAYWDELAMAVYVIFADHAPAFLVLPLKLLHWGGICDIKDAEIVLIAFLFWIRTAGSWACAFMLRHTKPESLQGVRDAMDFWERWVAAGQQRLWSGATGGRAPPDARAPPEPERHPKPEPHPKPRESPNLKPRPAAPISATTTGARAAPISAPISAPRSKMAPSATSASGNLILWACRR